MKNLNIEIMTDEQLLQNKNTFKLRFILALLAAIVLLIIGNVPGILGEYYPSSTLFKMSYIVFIIYAIRIFPKLRATNKELNKRDTN